MQELMKLLVDGSGDSWIAGWIRGRIYVVSLKLRRTSLKPQITHPHSANRRKS